MDAEFVAQSGAQTALKNQGIYSGMLGALLIASAFLPAGQVKVLAQLGLALFVLIVGIFGGLTANKKIFLVQALPAAITIAWGYWLTKREGYTSMRRSCFPSYRVHNHHGVWLTGLPA